MPQTPMPAGAGRMVQIDHDNVSPTRPAGRDARGIPREEVLPTLAKTERWIDRDGNICDVSLRTSRLLGMTSEDEKYESLIRREQILLGALPLGECPLTTEYAKLVNPARNPKISDSLIDNPKGERHCMGDPEGCKHLQPVIKLRRELALEAHKTQEAMNQQVPVAALEAMARGFGAGQNTSGAGGARANMAAGKGEPDK